MNDAIDQACIGRIEDGTEDGIKFLEFSCAYPWLGSFYTKWEKYYDPLPVNEWMQQHPLVPIATVVLYGLLIIVGTKAMEKREPWNWRKPLAAWNLFLSLFSWMGVLKTVPHLFHLLATQSLRENFCTPPVSAWGSGSTGLWSMLFILSKFPELFDTFFIVVHKKKLIFLHWYHHITVLLYCWHSYVTRSATGLYFIAMNYTVHAIMYGYYFLMAMKMKPKWFNPIVVTVAQISQMFIGIIVTVIAAHYYSSSDSVDSPCAIRKENNVAAFVMYGSYFLLFLQFFIRRYVDTKAKKNAKKNA